MKRWLALALLAAACGMMMPPPLSVSVIVPILRTNYFAATASDIWGSTSGYSSVVTWASTNRRSFVTLAWDPSPSADIINYRVHHGTVPDVYTNFVDAGTNLQASIRIRPPILSNLVVRVTATGGNLIRSPALGPIAIWTSLGTNFWQGTNPPTAFWRGLGNGSRVAVTNWMQ